MYAGLYSFNSLGLRDDESVLRPSAGCRRILAVGDSFTFGQGVAIGQTYPKRMEALLNRRTSGQRYQVINAGRTGASTVTELAFLKEHGLRLGPDLVLIQFYLNDVALVRRAPARGTPTDRLRRMVRRSYVLFFLRDRCTALRARPGDWSSRYVERVAHGTPAWRACASALDELGGVSRSTGVPIAIVLFPHPGLPVDLGVSVYRAVAERSRKAGLHVIDLTHAFEAIAPADQIVSEIDHHPSGAVHSAAAVEIVKALSRRGLLGAD
jgi:hypothetical protein